MANAFLPPRLKRFIWLTLAGITLAAIIHILVILALPGFAEKDAASEFVNHGDNGRAEPLKAEEIRDADRFAVYAVCAFDLSAGPFRVSARTGDAILSLSLHRHGGGVAYAITDRAAVRGALEFVVLTARQLEERQANDEEGETVRELRVVFPDPSGLLVARALARRPSGRAEAQALVAGVACGLAD